MKKFCVRLTSAGIVKAYPNEADGSRLFEFIDDNDIEVRDEFHTMHELYEHRMALNIALFHALYRDDYGVCTVMKSKLHHDGTMFDGYFIVMAFSKLGQISYHYKLKHWDKFEIPYVERIPVPYDGHDSPEVIERLMKL